MESGFEGCVGFFTHPLKSRLESKKGLFSILPSQRGLCECTGAGTGVGSVAGPVLGW